MNVASGSTSSQKKKTGGGLTNSKRGVSCFLVDDILHDVLGFDPLEVGHRRESHEWLIFIILYERQGTNEEKTGMETAR